MEVLRSLPMVFSRAPDYFSAYLGEYRNVLSALETLNAAVLAAMDKTKLVRTGPGAGSRAGGIGAVVSTAASSCEVWGSEAANPSNQGGAWACSGLSVCAGSAAGTQPGGWGAKAEEGKGKSKAFVLWRHHLPPCRALAVAVPAAPCRVLPTDTLWEHP